MAFVKTKCTICGRDIVLDDSEDRGFCLHCGSEVVREIEKENAAVASSPTYDALIEYGNTIMDVDQREADIAFNDALKLNVKDYKAWEGRIMIHINEQNKDKMKQEKLYDFEQYGPHREYGVCGTKAYFGFDVYELHDGYNERARWYCAVGPDIYDEMKNAFAHALKLCPDNRKKYLNRLYKVYIVDAPIWSEKFRAEKAEEKRLRDERLYKCYIATAVYGSYDAPEVMALRKFRDDVLLRSAVGRIFVAVYYRLSPPVAKRLKRTTHINKLIKKLLDKIVRHIEGK